MDMYYSLGKLPAEVLDGLLQKHNTSSPRVLVGPGIGMDCAVMEMGDRYLVAKTDPITFATDRIGWYAVHINANDIACSGGRPLWFMATVLLPEGGADEALVESIFDQIVEACDSVGASLVGGHTEITHGLGRPIVMGCLLGEVEKQSLVTAGGARVGDAVAVTGGIPIEATAILAREKEEMLVGKFEPEFLQRCRDFVFRPGISVVRAATTATGVADINAMHDPTEGGLATALWELAEASSCELELDLEAIPILPEGRALCEAFELDPMAATSSGALLLTTPTENLGALERAYAEQGIEFAAIGEVISRGAPLVTAINEGHSDPLPRPERDELAKLFE